MAKVTLQQFKQKLNYQAWKAVEEVSRELTNEIIDGTPIDTGAAKSNWKASDRILVTSNKNFTMIEQNRGRQLIRLIAFSKSLALKGKDIFISNALDYIRKLEYGPGRSRQAPHGMLRIGLSKVVNRRNHGN